MNKKPIICLFGQAGVGKDTVAQMICNQVPGFQVMAFADSLKRLCMTTHNIHSDLLWGPSELRSTVIENSSIHINNLKTFLRYGFDIDQYQIDRCFFNKTTISVRELLQIVGTDLVRNKNKDAWINETFKKIKQFLGIYDYSKFRFQKENTWKWFKETKVNAATGFVITDGRFQNEILAAKDNQALCVRIKNSRIVSNSTHPSELELNSMPDFWFDVVINNDNDKYDLEKQVELLVENYISPLYTQPGHYSRAVLD